MVRRLAAILALDVVGYSRLMEADEAGTLAALVERRKTILEPLLAQHRGRIVKLMGDGALVEFASAVDAVQCAVELQKRMAEADAGSGANRAIILRIGINLGDVVVEGRDLYGDGVNVAARLEALAEPGGVWISAAVHEQVGRHLPYEFQDLGDQSLKNLARSVRVYRVAVDVPRVPPQPEAALRPPIDTSIAVLPFANMSGDPDQEYFADGLTEDIIAALSRISTLFVIARTSTFTYKGQPSDAKRVARELGVRYVMEGSVRRAGGRLRVTAQLIDAATGHQVWAERYDRAVADLFDIQDEITRSVAASTETQIVLAGDEAVKSRPSGDAEARDIVMQGMSRMYDETSEAYAEAFALAEKAIRIDPAYPHAHLLLGAAFINWMALGGIPHDATNIARGLEFAKAALRLDSHDERAHWLMGMALGHAGRLEDAVAACERGLAINPNSSSILMDMGSFLALLGRHEDAIAACRLTLRLNPRNPANYWCHSAIATAHFVAADYEAALHEATKVARWRPDFLRGPLLWAAAAAALERPDEARAAIERCLAQRPDLRLGNVAPHILLRFARDEDHERLLALLRKAGLPE
jgi:TolB-like protein/class 3 adenylate cyclase/cytochrome c-type biogenesis protein CcmH/NrfG